MSSERKIIQFNPELFKIPEKKPRKPKTGGHSNTAKSLPKARLIPKHNKSLKNSVLRMIRNKQQESYKQLFQSGAKTDTQNNPVGQTAKPAPTPNKDVQSFNNDFEESLKFANDFMERQKHAIPKHNRTLKQYPTGGSNMMDSEIMVNTVLPDDVFNNVYSKLPMPTTKSSVVLNRTPTTSAPMRTALPPPPKWGCLKGGKNPTYRAFHNHKTTVKNYPSLAPPIPPPPPPPQLIQPRPLLQIGGMPAPTPVSDAQTNLDKMKTHSEKQKHQQRIPKLKYKKRKKTLKRTYTVGRSKYFPKIGVLISNKTIRNKTTEKIQLLKQTPMPEIRKFLIKRGFIKVGTPAPNDLLRKMYETIQLVCGEIQNHNPENLLHNFLNDK
jgi:hypothetical protein